MDFGARAIREAQFREKMRGYNPEDVDTFLEQVARGVEVLEERNHKLGERIEQLEEELVDASNSRVDFESPPPPATASVEPNQELLEIFQLAKRTADELLAKAETDAADLIADTKRNAADLERTARAELTALREKETERLTKEVREFEAKRDALLEELHRLAELSSDARSKVRDALTAAMSAVESSFGAIYPESEEEDDEPSVINPNRDDLFDDLTED